MNILILTCVVLWIGVFGTTISGSVSVYSFLRLLRQEHSTEWDRLGRPTLLMNNSIQNSVKFLRFLAKKDYLSLRDAELTNRAARTRRLLGVQLLLFLLALCISGILLGLR